MSRGPRKNCILATKVTEHTMKLVDKAIEETGMSKSDWLRMLVFLELKEPKLKIEVKD